MAVVIFVRNDRILGEAYIMKITVNSCPGCGALLDAASNLQDIELAPKPNDISICIYCGIFLQYDNNRGLELIDDEMKLPDEVLHQLRNIRRTITAMRSNDR